MFSSKPLILWFKNKIWCGLSYLAAFIIPLYFLPSSVEAGTHTHMDMDRNVSPRRLPIHYGAYPLAQWFSTFFNSRHTKHEKKNTCSSERASSIGRDRYAKRLITFKINLNH